MLARIIHPEGCKLSCPNYNDVPIEVYRKLDGLCAGRIFLTSDKLNFKIVDVRESAHYEDVYETVGDLTYFFHKSWLSFLKE